MHYTRDIVPQPIRSRIFLIIMSELHHPSSFHGNMNREAASHSNSFHHSINNAHGTLNNTNNTIINNNNNASNVFFSSNNNISNAMEQKDMAQHIGGPLTSNILLSSLDQGQHSSAMSSVSSGNNNSSSATISSQGAVSLFRYLVNDKLLSYLAKGHSSDRIQGWKWNVFYGFLHFYYLYASVVLPLLSTYGNSYHEASTLVSPYGYDAGWLFRALTYPITFSLDDIHVPYELLIVLAVIMMCLVLVLPVLVVWSARSLFGKSQTNLRSYSNMLAFGVLIMAPVFTFILTGKHSKRMTYYI